MIRNILILIVLMLTSLSANAQGVLKGHVVDEGGEPLPGIIVKVFDAAGEKLLAYGTTDDKGGYSIDAPQQAGGMLLRFNAMGYGQEERKVEKFGDMGHIVLKESEMVMKEVSVRAAPVTTRGDTINYNVAQLKEKNDRKIEDVIKKIPGVEIDGGQIKYNGKPINKFYIEGADMLGGRYSLASKNIDADDIVTISVYQNHQPKRALKGIVLSDQAALNLKLKEQRMLKPIGNVSVGMGYGDEALWSAEAFTLLVAPKKQFLITAKGNNMARFYDDESADNFSEGSSVQPLTVGRLQPILTGASYVPTTRSQSNRSASSSYNSLRKLAEDVQLTINGGYQFGRIGNRQDKRTTFWTEGENAIVIDENSQSRATTHQGWLTLKFENNKPTLYIDEILKAEGEIRDYRDWLTGNSSIGQKVKTGNYLITNDLEAVWRRGNTAFNLLSFTTWGNAPQNRLTATATTSTTNDSLIVSQDMEGMKLHTQESTSYSWVLSRVVTLALNASFQADYDCMDARFVRMDEYESMRYGGYGLKTEVTPTLSLSAGSMGGSISMVGEIDNLHYKDRLDGVRYDYDKPQVGVRASFSFRFRRPLIVTMGASHMRSLGNMTNYITQSVYTTYRNRSALGTGLLNTHDKTSANMGLTYRNVLNGVNANVLANYQHTRGNVTRGSMVTASQTVSLHEKRSNDADLWMVAARVSRNIYDWHTVLSLTGDVSINNVEMLRQGTFYKMSNNIYSLEGSVKASVFRRYAALDASARYTLSTQHVSMQDVTTRNNDYSLNAGITVFPLPGWGVYVRANSTFVEVPTTTSSHYSNCLYLDAGTQYAFGKFELEVSARNLTNRKRYQLRQFSTCDTFDYIYYLRPLEATATLRYSF